MVGPHCFRAAPPTCPAPSTDRPPRWSILGVGQLGLQPESYIEAHREHTVRAVGARRVVLTHWDDFFRPLDRPLRALPYAGDDLDVTMGILDRLATADGVGLHLPTLWRREDPWADIIP